MHRARSAARVDTLEARAGAEAGPVLEGAVVDLLAAALPARLDEPAVLTMLATGQRGIVRGEARVRRLPDESGPTLEVSVASPNAMVATRVGERGRRVLRVTFDYGARRLVLTRVGGAPRQ